MNAIISLSREECLRLHESLRREWLETDGLGGFASSTVLLCPTRRYHGLLLAAVPGNPRRHSFLARFEEDIRGGERDFFLSMARYPGTWMPQGHQGITRFENHLDGLVRVALQDAEGIPGELAWHALLDGAARVPGGERLREKAHAA